MVGQSKGGKGVSSTRFFVLLGTLEEEKKIYKSPIDEKWERIRGYSRNSNAENDQ